MKFKAGDILIRKETGFPIEFSVEIVSRHKSVNDFCYYQLFYLPNRGFLASHTESYLIANYRELTKTEALQYKLTGKVSVLERAS